MLIRVLIIVIVFHFRSAQKSLSKVSNIIEANLQIRKFLLGLQSDFKLFVRILALDLKFVKTILNS